MSRDCAAATAKLTEAERVYDECFRTCEQAEVGRSAVADRLRPIEVRISRRPRISFMFCIETDREGDAKQGRSRA